MAEPLSADALLATLRKWRVNFREYPGWKTRTRPGASTPIGFLQHHTGGPFTHSASYLEFLFVTGRPSEGIPGPLCNFAITDDGVCWIGSRLRTNNAGAGDWQTREKIGAENYPGYTSEITPGADDYGAGNQYYWGVEICYPGTVPMRAVQYATAVRLGAAVVDAYGWSALSTAAHREHSERKWDPGQMALTRYRIDVRALLATLNPPSEDDMNAEQDRRLKVIEDHVTAITYRVDAMLRMLPAANFTVPSNDTDRSEPNVLAQEIRAIKTEVTP